MAQISIDIAGQTLTWNHGPPEPIQFQWPGTNGKTLVRVTMTPASGGQGQVTERDGPWALLRLLDAAQVTPSGQPDRFQHHFHRRRRHRDVRVEGEQRQQPVHLGCAAQLPLPPEAVIRGES